MAQLADKRVYAGHLACGHFSVASQRLNLVQPQPRARQIPNPKRAELSQNSHRSQVSARMAYVSTETVLNPAAAQRAIERRDGLGKF
jgi:hypothetical protein